MQPAKRWAAASKSSGSATATLAASSRQPTRSWSPTSPSASSPRASAATTSIPPPASKALGNSQQELGQRHGDARRIVPTTYEVLESNFPVGLLPKGVSDYDLNPATGKFSAYHNSCSFSLEGSYKLRYQSTISGVTSRYRLRGMSVKILLFWINIVEVERRGDNLELSPVREAASRILGLYSFLQGFVVQKGV